MPGLLLLKHQTAETARSPELRYLASCLLAAARSVFGEVEEFLWRPEASRGPASSEGVPVLVVGQEAVHLSARSLRRMKTALDAGAGVVVPDRLASFALVEEEPIYTLRGFERVEKRILDEGLEPRERSGSHLPVALFSGRLFAARLRALPLATLLTDRRLLAELDLADELARAGVFHDYIDYYGEAREDLLPYVPEGVREVLEIGCGRGMTGKLLQERRRCRVTGIEVNEQVAKEAARQLHRVIVGDIETLELDGRFDAVVATELFEHLSYPETFLAKMKALVNTGGRIVLSVPNVGHYSIAEDLLAGRWDYLPIGLLCYTHLRFFTRATLAAWIERAGFASYEIVAQTTELPERFAALAERFDVDLESLATKGFFVVLEVG